MGRDAREEVHFYQTGELAGGDFVFLADGFEEGEVEEFGGGDADTGAFLGEFGVEVCFEGDLGEGVVGEEAGVVAVVAEVIEGFVGVFDCDFYAGGVGEEGFYHGVVEVGAVAVGVVGGEDEELGDAGSVGEGIWCDGLLGGKGEVLKMDVGRLMWNVGYESVGG